MPGIQLSAQHIALQDGNFEPQRANNAVIVVEGLAGWGSPRTDAVTLSLESFPLPKETNTSIALRWQNEVRKVAGPASLADMEIVVKDFVDVPVARFLLAWRRQVYEPSHGRSSSMPTDGAIGWAARYKKTARIILVGPDGTAERTWVCQGVFPLSMDPGDIDMASEDIVKIRMTLSVDRIYNGLGIGGVEPGAAAPPVQPPLEGDWLNTRGFPPR